MTPFACPRETELAHLLQRGQWPQASPADLRAHVAACRRCSDLVLVTQSLQSARTHAASTATLPTAGALWWRAQLRRRNQAIERIRKPILGAQIFAFMMSLLVAFGLLAWQLQRGFRLTAWLEDFAGSLHFDALLPSSLFALDGRFWLLFPILAMLALVGGLVVYFASEKQ